MADYFVDKQVQYSNMSNNNFNFPHVVWFFFYNKWVKFKTTVLSLFYNDHLSGSYVTDIIMEPMLWFVDNFTKFLGPIFVTTVAIMTLSVVVISYWVGLPHWWQRNSWATVALILIGHWLLVNVAFHFYMGCTVSPGLPPEGVFIPEAVSICKKCIAPKPPRTHHCSICNKCILKMDHHCPWLNNCVGMWNHRHFFLYMAYTTLGVLFLIVFGVGIFLERVWWQEEELEGHPVRINNSVLVAALEFDQQFNDVTSDRWERGAVIYMAFLCSGVLIALGSLTMWHARLITRGETSIEANINKTERVRYSEMGQVYINPYNLGWRRNWAALLGLEGLTTLEATRRVLLPSCHNLRGNGLNWPSTFSEQQDLISIKKQ